MLPVASSRNLRPAVKAVQKSEGGRVAMAHRANNEQGFALRLHGYTDRLLRDFDGIVLVAVRNAEAMDKAEKLSRQVERYEHKPLTASASDEP
jgi:CRISPR-associated protein Cas2